MASIVLEDHIKVVEELLCNFLNFGFLVAFLAFAGSESKKMQALKFLLLFNLNVPNLENP